MSGILDRLQSEIRVRIVEERSQYKSRDLNGLREDRAPKVIKIKYVDLIREKKRIFTIEDYTEIEDK